LAGCQAAPPRKASIVVEVRKRYFTRLRASPVSLEVTTGVQGETGVRLIAKTREALTSALAQAGIVLSEDAPVKLEVNIVRLGFGAFSLLADNGPWRCATITLRVVRGGHAFAAIEQTAQRCLPQQGSLNNGQAMGSADLEKGFEFLADPEGRRPLDIAFGETLEELLNILDS
jgi:hypothetical protein